MKSIAVRSWMIGETGVDGVPRLRVAVGQRNAAGGSPYVVPTAIPPACCSVRRAGAPASNGSRTIRATWLCGYQSRRAAIARADGFPAHASRTRQKPRSNSRARTSGRPCREGSCSFD